MWCAWTPDLGYEGGIRVAIFTANFVDGDFNDLSNAVWMQDFPLKTEGRTVCASDTRST